MYAEYTKLQLTFLILQPWETLSLGHTAYHELVQFKTLTGSVKVLPPSKITLAPFLLRLNPIKAGGSESMYSLGGVPSPPPLEKGLRE